MKIIGYDPFLSADRAAEQGIELSREVDDIVTRCDFLTVHTPLTDETRGLINAERMQRMKNGARIINCARGGIVDEEALADAIESGHIAGAALDVFVQEPPGETRLTSLPQVLCTPHLGASTEEAQELVAVEAAEIISGFLLRNEIRHAVNMVPISAAEMADMKQYLNLGHRLGLLLAQLNKGGNVKSAQLQYRGEVASKKTDLITSAFAAGLLESALDESVNIVNAPLLAQERGIEIDENKSSDHGNFSTMVTATLKTDSGEISAAGTLFGTEFLRLVRLDQFHLDAYLDGLLLIYRHRDRPGQIGFIGTVFGKHGVNIAHMALGRQSDKPGGPSIAVLNLDNEPSSEALKEVATHHDVSSVELVHLPTRRCPAALAGGVVKNGEFPHRKETLHCSPLGLGHLSVLAGAVVQGIAGIAALDEEIAEVAEVVGGAFHVVFVAQQRADPGLHPAGTFGLGVVRGDFGGEIQKIIDFAVHRQRALAFDRQGIQIREAVQAGNVARHFVKRFQERTADGNVIAVAARIVGQGLRPSLPICLRPSIFAVRLYRLSASCTLAQEVVALSNRCRSAA